MDKKKAKIKQEIKYKFGAKPKYTKAVAISKDNLLWLDTVRGRKSKAGKLNEIIDFYKSKQNL